MEGSSVQRFRSACVFCGSNIGKDPEFYRVVDELGKTHPARQIRLIYGGGCLGLMEGVPTVTVIGGSKVLGVIPKALNKLYIIGVTLRDELEVPNMQERMIKMLANFDAFIILPGGFGMLAELFQVISWAQLNIHKKSIGILNVNGFFNGLLSFFDRVEEQEFISLLARQIFITAPTVDQLIDQLQMHQPKLDPEMALLDWSDKQTSKKCK